MSLFVFAFMYVRLSCVSHGSDPSSSSYADCCVRGLHHTVLHNVCFKIMVLQYNNLIDPKWHENIINKLPNWGTDKNQINKIKCILLYYIDGHMNDIKLINSVFALPNKDKGTWVETWSEETHGLSRLVHPFKCLFAGRPNSGKTTLMHNLFLHIQTSDKPFQTLIIIQPGTSKEHDMLDPTCILNDIPDPETLVAPENGKCLIIIDDFDLTKLNKLQEKHFSMLFRYISSHHNISVMLSYQSFFSVPTIIRKTCNYFVIWKTNNLDELSTIAKRCGMTKEVFKKIFKANVIDKRDSIMIDQVSPHELRKNIFEVIYYEDFE